MAHFLLNSHLLLVQFPRIPHPQHLPLSYLNFSLQFIFNAFLPIFYKKQRFEYGHYSGSPFF